MQGITRCASTVFQLGGTSISEHDMQESANGTWQCSGLVKAEDSLLVDFSFLFWMWSHA
ncbi:allantoate permease [Moniliophthora roreri]|nr:allantoate permease [Moniliophthora roreri]